MDKYNIELYLPAHNFSGVLVMKYPERTDVPWEVTNFLIDNGGGYATIYREDGSFVMHVEEM